MNVAALLRRGLVYVLLSIAAFVSVFPFYWMIVGATNRSSDIVTGKPDFGGELFNNAARFFATVDGLGGDGLVPVSTLGSERFFYDEAARTLDSEHGRVSYSVGQRIDLRLMEANPISGALRFELPDAPEGGFRNRPPRRDGLKGKDKSGKHMIGKRGRPGNIRHQGRKR